MDLACFHISDFPAWALARRAGAPASGRANGAPADKALAACDQGRVLAATPALRGLVAVGDPVDRARRLAPHARFLLRDPAVERATWGHLLSRLYDLSPQVQPIPDPLSREPAPRWRGSREMAGGPASGRWHHGAWAWVQGAGVDGLEILAAEVGARVGRAPARSWALLAAAYADRGTVTTVPGPMVPAFLRQAPVGLLDALCFTPELVERLGLFGLRTLGHALFLTRRHLQAQFGAEGLRLFELLHPPPTEPPVAPLERRWLRAAHDFEWPVFEPADLEPVLHHLLAQLISHLEGRRAGHLEVVLEGRGGRRRRAYRLLREPTAHLDTLCGAAGLLLHRALTDTATQGIPAGRGVHRLAVTLGDLAAPPLRQAGLFPDRRDRLPSLWRAIEARFPGRLARPVRTHADPFFPEEEYHFEPVAPDPIPRAADAPSCADPPPVKGEAR